MTKPASIFLLIASFFIFNRSLAISTFEMPEKVNAERARAGETALSDYRVHAQHSKCWKTAVDRIETGCRRMNDAEQRKLAIAFTNCHLAASGKPTYPCDDESDVAACTKDMDVLSFNAYTEFFTHTGHICFFLHQVTWQEKTELTITTLAENSHRVSEGLQESLGYHKELLEYEKTSLDNQELMMAAERDLKESLAETTQDMKQSFEEINQTSTHVFGNFMIWLKKIAYVQSLVLGEFIGIQAFLMYVLGALVAYLLTATNQTGGARLWIYIVLVGSFSIERLILYVIMSFEMTLAQQMEWVYWILWYWRSLAGFVCFAIWLYKVITFKDLNEENNKLLRELLELSQHQRQHSNLLPAPELVRAVYVSSTPQKPMTVESDVGEDEYDGPTSGSETTTETDGSQADTGTTSESEGGGQETVSTPKSKLDMVESSQSTGRYNLRRRPIRVLETQSSSPRLARSRMNKMNKPPSASPRRDLRAQFIAKKLGGSERRTRLGRKVEFSDGEYEV